MKPNKSFLHFCLKDPRVTNKAKNSCWGVLWRHSFVVNFANILRAAFSPIFLPKNTQTVCREKLLKTLA